MSPRRWDCMTKGLHLSLLQRIGSIICIFALLFSNVAGFVHLGCTQSASGKPHTHQHLSDTSHDHLHHHCGHSHSHAVSDVDNQTSSGDHSWPQDSRHSDHHDEDTCHVCQSLYNHDDSAISTESQDSIIELAQTERTCLYDKIFCGELLVGLKLVRGPPQV